VPSFLLRPQDKIVFIGDSITDCGRRTDTHGPYGSGYVAMIRNLLIATHPEYGFAIENRGIGGNTVRDLQKRWTEDALALQPTVLSVKIGNNDAWRFVKGRDAEGVPVPEFEATYRDLLTRARQQTRARLVLVEPYVINADPNDAFRALIEQYLAVVRRLAAEFNAPLVPTQAAIDSALASQPATFWANDGVHPYPPGHMVIARAWLKTMGYAF